MNILCVQQKRTLREAISKSVGNLGQHNTSKTDVAPWCYKWTDWMGWDGMDGSLGEVKYRAPYGANN